jgi:integrase
MKPGCNVATLIERYFTERLMRQRNVSANTIASYRDTFRLLFTFAQARLRKPPSALVLDDLDAPFIGAFLTDLEMERGVGVRTRNLRLTTIRSFFRFVSFEEPAHSALIQRVLAIPSKRHDKRQVHFLMRPEIEAILATPDRTTWLGRRDYTLLLVAVQTGLRLSELISLDRDAVHLGAGAHVPQAYLDGNGPYPERLPWLLLVGQFLVDFYLMVEQWADWASEIVEKWPDDVTGAEPDGKALERQASVTRSHVQGS